MAFDKDLATIGVTGGKWAVAASVAMARDAQATGDISQEELDAIKAMALLTDTEVDNTVSEARNKLGL